jgi:hypothetical protein
MNSKIFTENLIFITKSIKKVRGRETSSWPVEQSALALESAEHDKRLRHVVGQLKLVSAWAEDTEVLKNAFRTPGTQPF